MLTLGKRTLGLVLWGATLAVCSVVAGSRPAVAVELGDPAPDFTLPSTNGVDISLGDFKGKKWVFLEFYGVDFQPA
jgi:AhpC/TSA family